VKLLLSVGLSLMLLSATAQRKEFWGDVTITVPISDKLMLFADGGPRRALETKYPYSFYVRPSFVYRINQQLSVMGGLAWFGNALGASHLHEIRGWQGIRFDTFIMKQIQVNNYIRLEERKFNTDTQADFLLRFRWLTGFTFLINSDALEKGTFYTPLSFEWFEDLNDKQWLINKTRIYAGVGYALSGNSRIEVFYINNTFRTSARESFVANDVLRMRLHFTLN